VKVDKMATAESTAGWRLSPHHPSPSGGGGSVCRSLLHVAGRKQERVDFNLRMPQVLSLQPIVVIVQQSRLSTHMACSYLET
jgi:hypothetical protein